MFTGHFAAALAGAGASRRLPLSLLIVAAFAADLSEGVVAAFNVNDPTRVWSHSLPATTAVGVLLALAWKAAGGSWRDSGLLLVVAMSHTALDFVTAVKTVWPGTRPMGFHLYRHRYADWAVEAACCVAGWLVWRASLNAERRRSALVWSMLIVLLLVQSVLLLQGYGFALTLDPDALSKFVR